MSLMGWTDADRAGGVDSARSTGGYVFTLNGGAISWRSAKQKSVAKSTAEAEYMASSDAAQKAMWIRYLLPELGEQLDGPTVIQGDNQGLSRWPRTQWITDVLGISALAIIS